MATGWGATPAQGGSRRHRPAGAAGRVVKATVSSQRQQAAAILEQLSDVVTGVLGAAVPPNQPLMEAGLDSLGAVELRNAVAATFNLQLPATVTFDYPTLASLAAFVAEHAAEVDGSSALQLEPLSSQLTLAADEQLGGSSSVTALAAVSCRYPAPGSTNHPAGGFAPSSATAGGSNADLAGFESAIAAGVSLQSVVPPQRWDVDACYHPDGGTRRMYVRFGGWLDGLAAFDAAAFRLSASEAVCLDPQARMLLEHTQELLASPAVTAAAGAWQSSVGVYVGCMYTEYLDGVLAPAGVADANSNAIVGHGLSFLVGRTSYTFGLQGPCVSTDTACSSSLVALHMAHSGILAAESAAGVAGGVNVMLIPQTTARICLLQALSPVGRCKTFDASADGYGRGEAVALAMLQHADLASGMPGLLGLVHGSAVNQDGRSSSLTAPNGPAQTALVRAALTAADAQPASVSFVSLHGTGTPLGDPIEVGALGSAAGGKAAAAGQRVLALGSSKSCYGHTEGTAGLTGGLLAVCALNQAALTPIVNLREINPYVSAALADWHTRLGLAAAPSRQLAPAAHLAAGAAAQRLAGTSSFGMSGVNAHAVLSASAAGGAVAAAPSLERQRAAYWPTPQPHPLLLMAAVRQQPTAAGRLLELAADLSAPGLSWLRDHGVTGTVLLPGAAMFEMAAAAVAACQPVDGSLQAGTALAGLAILAPCVLPAAGSRDNGSLLLRCAVDCRSGMVEVLGASGSRHLQAHAAVAGSRPLVQQAAGALSSSTAGVLPMMAAAPAAGHNFAKVEASRQNTAGYCLHPGVFDACIHLAPVPAAGAAITVTRVPVTAGALLLPATDGVSNSGWAVAASLHISSEDNSALNDMHWCSGSSGGQPSCMHLTSLLAKAMPAPAAAAAPAAQSELLYTVEWQAHSSHSGSSRGSTAVAAAPTPLWQLDGRNTRVSGRQHTDSDAAFAASHLAVMQTAVSHLTSGADVRLVTTAAVWPAADGGSSSRPGAQQQQALWGMLKVAALDAAELQWAHNSRQPQQPAAVGTPPSSDAYSMHSAAGAWLQPRLLPAEAAGQRSAASICTGCRPGAIVVAGGLGALGTLIAAQQLSGSSSPHLVLLGRSVGLASLEAALGAAWRRAAGSGGTAVLTVRQCDSAAASDSAGVALGLRCAGVAVGSLIHAAGVLKDALLTNQTAANLRAAIAPKSVAACSSAAHLSWSAPIGSLQLFSSIASLLGSGGQASYAAANALLDATAEGWQAQGLAAFSIAWGAWGGAGMAAANPAVAARLARVGVAAIQPVAGLAALEQATVAARSGIVMAAALLWERLLVDGRQQAPYFAEFAAVAAAVAAQTGDPAGADASVTVAVARSRRPEQPAKQAAVLEPAKAAAAASLPPWATMGREERVAFFVSQLSALVAHAAGKEVGPNEPLLSAGLDSLGAVEVRREATQLAGFDLPVTLIFDYPSVAEMAAFIVGKLPAHVEQPVAAPLVPVAAGTAGASRARSSSRRQRTRRQAAAPQPLAQLSVEERYETARSKVHASVAAVLGGAEVAASMPLMSAGLDSLSAVELRKKLSSAFGVDLPPTVVFDYPTIDDLVSHLAPHVRAPPVAAAAAAAASDSDCDSDSESDGSSAGQQEGGGAAMAAANQRQLAVRRSSSDREQEPPNTQLVPSAVPGAIVVVNKRAPRLTKPGYFTVPSIERLACMTDDQLRAVPRFVIGHSDVGEVAFLYPVNLLDADLDDIVSIERGRIGLYPSHQPPAPPATLAALPGPAPAASKGRLASMMPAPGSPAAAAGRRRARMLANLAGRNGSPLAIAAPPKVTVRPPPGEGLNQPALLTFHRMSLRQPADRRAVAAFRGRLLEAAARMGGVFVHYDPDEGVWMLKLDTWL